MGRLTVDDFKKSTKTPLYVVLDNVRSLNNIGSVFRTCDAFAVKKLLLCGITATPPHKDINRTALGATESVEWEYFPSTAQAIASLKEKGDEEEYKRIITEACAKNLNQFSVPREIVFMDELPHTPLEKVDFMKLEKM